jgi:hypothetical protein
MEERFLFASAVNCEQDVVEIVACIKTKLQPCGQSLNGSIDG